MLQPREGGCQGTPLLLWPQDLVSCRLYKPEGQTDLQPTIHSYHILVVAPFILLFAKQV